MRRNLPVYGTAVGIKFGVSVVNRITPRACTEWHIFCFRYFQGPCDIRRALPLDGDPGLRVPQAVAVVPRQPLRLLHGRIVRPSPHLPVRERDNLISGRVDSYRTAHVVSNPISLYDALLMRRDVVGIDTDY